MAQEQGQKFIARNRAPRVQIEYDVEIYGAEKKVQLPFVMGVMADLVGKRDTPLPPVAERKFVEIDVDNFNDRLKALKPRAAFTVPNTLSGEGNMAVDMTFESMDDFSPGRDRPQGRAAAQAARSARAALAPAHLHGRQGQCRAAHRPAVARQGAAAGTGRRRQARKRMPSEARGVSTHVRIATLSNSEAPGVPLRPTISMPC